MVPFAQLLIRSLSAAGEEGCSTSGSTARALGWAPAELGLPSQLRLAKLPSWDQPAHLCEAGRLWHVAAAAAGHILAFLLPTKRAMRLLIRCAQ